MGMYGRVHKYAQESGLLGLAGVSDMKEVCDLAKGGDQRAADALQVWVHRVRKCVSSAARYHDDQKSFQAYRVWNQPKYLLAVYH